MKNLFYFLLILFTSPSVAQNWSSVNGNNFRNGLSRATGPSSATVPYWTATSTNPADIGANIYAYNDRFVMSRVKFSPYNAKIECRDLHTGSLIWVSPFISATSILYTAGFNEHAVYAHDYDTDSLYALSPVNGSIIWKCAVTSMSFAPMDGVFFTCTNDIIINGPDPVVSTMRISRETGDTIWTNTNVISVTPSAVMAVNDSCVYRIDGSIVTPKRLYAIDVNTGITKYYSASVPGDGDQENPLTIGPDGTIYFLRDGGFVYAFRDNGAGFTQLWTYNPVSLPLGLSNITIDINKDLLMLDNGRVIRISHVTGMATDSSLITLSQARITVGADSTVYVNDMTSMYYALSHDLQTVKFSLNAGTNYYAGPVIAKDGVFIIAGAGTSIAAYKDSVTIAPVADFSADTTIVSAGSPLQFNDQSSFVPASWQWSFPGAATPSSNVQNPAGIIYSIPGTYEVSLTVTNIYGSDSVTKTCYIEVIQASDIDESDATHGVTVYPNPVSEYFQINTPGSCTLSCFDFQGKCILPDLIFNTNIKVDVTNWKPGVYLLRFRDGKKEYSKKLVVIE